MAKKITMMSSDGKPFEVEEAVAMEMQMIKDMIEDDCVNGAIPMPNVAANILSKVLDYCKKHAAAGKGKSSNGDDIKAWDSNFINVDQNTLYFLLLAANYLNIKSLMDLGSQKFADMIRGKTPEEIRQIFNIKNDFTPEEEEKIRNENRWAFE